MVAITRIDIRRLWPAVVAILGIVPGALLVAAVWQVEADGVSPVTGKWPTWDYTNLWAGGVLASAGKLRTLFDPVEYSAWLRSILSPRVEDHEWSYPPTMLLLGLPLARLPLIPSYLTCGPSLRWRCSGARCAGAVYP